MKIGAQGWRGLLPAHLKTIMGCGLKLSSQMQMQPDPIPFPMPRNLGKLCPAASYSCIYMVGTFAARLQEERTQGLGSQSQRREAGRGTC